MGILLTSLAPTDDTATPLEIPCVLVSARFRLYGLKGPGEEVALSPRAHCAGPGWTTAGFFERLSNFDDLGCRLASRVRVRLDARRGRLRMTIRGCRRIVSQQHTSLDINEHGRFRSTDVMEKALQNS